MITSYIFNKTRHKEPNIEVVVVDVDVDVAVVGLVVLVGVSTELNDRVQ